MTIQFTIRQATVSDSETLARLGADTFIESFGHLYAQHDLNAFLETSHSAEAYQAKLEGPSEAWLAFDELGQDQGYAIIGPCQMPVSPMPRGAGELSRLYLRRHVQGAGLGSQLLALALDRLDQAYAEHYLSVFSENLGAQRLYQRYGFEKMSEYKFMVGNHADHEFIYHRVRRIRPSPLAGCSNMLEQST